MTDVGDPESRPRLLAALFVGIAVLMIADLADDLRARIDVAHLVLEGGVVVLAAFGIAVLWAELGGARFEARRLGSDLAAARADALKWRSEAEEALRGLGAAMAAQFERWELTAAERAVALRLLQGLSHKEVAQRRDTSERTVRQQALAVYRKAGVRSRAELSAFFLRDLPVPGEPESA